MPQNVLTSRTSNWIHLVSLVQSVISQAPEGRVGASPLANYPNLPTLWRTRSITLQINRDSGK